MPQYISTDPNAGQAYLSTDPNAGAEQSPTDMPIATMASGAVIGAGKFAGKAAPAIVSGVNRAASAAASMNPMVANAVGAVVPKAGMVPKVAGIIAKATAPAQPVPIGILNSAGQMITRAGTPGILMRGAGWLSRAAGKVAGPLGVASATYDGVQMIDSLSQRYEALSKSSDPKDQIEAKAILHALTGAGAF